MKIALPTNDCVSISEHFGRSSHFVLIETENGQIISREIKDNTATHSHAQGSYGEHAEAGEHNHAAILAALAGCDVVICAGMGWRAAEALKQAGIQEVIVTSPGPIEERLQAYLSGELPRASQSFCHCSH